MGLLKFVGLVVLTVATAGLLQVADMPAWLSGLVPFLTIVITYLGTKTPLASFGVRNLSAVAAGVIGFIMVVLTKPDVGSLPVYDGDVALWIGAIVDWTGIFWLLWLGWWKESQIAFDLITGQATTPSGHAARLIARTPNREAKVKP